MTSYPVSRRSALAVGNHRLKSLDGLRGLAALVVVFHHSLLLNPAIDAAQFGDAPVSFAAGLMAFTPLHLVWAGGEAVFLFFVLSGLVLTFPTMRANFDWAKYFPSRVVRIYLPVAAAVAFQIVLITFIHRDTGTSSSEWVNAHINVYTYGGVVSDLTLVGGISHVISPLWSLAWEIFFSMGLPVYIAVASKVNAWVVVLGSFALIAVGSTSQTTFLLYMPMFGVGVGLAYGWKGLTQWAAGMNARAFAWVFWAALLVLSVVATLNPWLLLRSPAFANWTTPISVVGVTGLIVLAAFSPLAKGLLSLSGVVWLGRISFSLYLIHEPIVMSMAFVLPNHPTMAAAISVAIAIPVAWVFYRFVELPIHRLSQRIAGRRPSVFVTAPDQVESSDRGGEGWVGRSK